jgi:hypothetical protein
MFDSWITPPYIAKNNRFLFFHFSMIPQNFPGNSIFPSVFRSRFMLHWKQEKTGNNEGGMVLWKKQKN